jgi:AAA ATPase domain
MDAEASDPMRLRSEAGKVFSPATPIDGRDLFAGRARQLQTLGDVVCQRGQHAIVFGERGVGKTSLVNVLPEFIPDAGLVLAASCNCDSTDSYATLWRKLFRRIPVLLEEQTMGLRPAVTTSIVSVADDLPPDLTPDIVVQALGESGKQSVLVVIIDEFDRLPAGVDSRLFADTIKMLSDYAAPVTLILVGVADSVDQLIAGHQSVERALVQVPMPRMSDEEIREIVLTRLPRLDLTISPQALKQLSTLARGLPHYAHLLGLHAARSALADGAKEILPAHLLDAVREAIGNASQSIRSLYHKGTSSPRKDNLYCQTILACAVAEPDALGYFAPADVRGPFNQIMMDKTYPVSAFTKHLHDLCDPKRGPLLQKTGDKHKHRFRFTDSLLQPFVLMHGLSTGMISQAQLEEMT